MSKQIKKATTKALLGSLAAAFITSLSTLSSAQSVLPGKIHVGLIYPISSNGITAPLDTNNISINLLAGVSGAERGLAFAGLSNVVRHDAKGLQIAGFSNHINKDVEGALFAGFLNTYGGGKGPAFAGFANIARKDLEGAQFAGFINVAENLDGAQFAGFANVAGKRTTQSQFAGFMNVAKDIKGSQFAGFINIARKVQGAQIAGFINIAERSDYPIGIVNIIKYGEKSIGVTYDDAQTAILALRSGGRVLYGIIGGGYNFKNTDEKYAFEAGFGAHVINTNIFRLNFEATASALESFHEGEFFKASGKLMPAIKITPWFEIFGGPTFNFISTNTEEGRNHKDKYLRQWEPKYGDDFQALYIGYQTGVSVVF